MCAELVSSSIKHNFAITMLAAARLSLTLSAQRSSFGPCTVLNAKQNKDSRTSFSTCAVLHAKRWQNKTELPFQSELRNPVSVVYGGSEIEGNAAVKGQVYDKKPCKVRIRIRNRTHSTPCMSYFRSQ